MALPDKKLEVKVDSILEGCFHDSVGLLQYVDLNLKIPKNARLLSMQEYFKFQLYGLTKDFKSIEKIDRCDPTSAGFPIDSKGSGAWYFGGPRSIITKDGRMYISRTFFEEGFRFYLARIPEILEDCKKVYSGEQTL